MSACQWWCVLFDCDSMLIHIKWKLFRRIEKSNKILKRKKNGKNLLRTSSYMNCNVNADLPTPPDPTIITLCTGTGCCGMAKELAFTGCTVDDFIGLSSLENVLFHFISFWFKYPPACNVIDHQSRSRK